MKDMRRAVCLALVLFFFASARAEAALPVVSITSPRLNYFVPREGELTVTDAFGDVFSSAITVKYRGSSSISHAGKRKYSVHLKAADGAQNKAALLGLRTDDDWVLDGMLSDLSRMRNRVALDIWDDLYTLPWADVSGAAGGAFAELWFNGGYKGIYCLNERLDRKLLALSDAGGRIYRTNNPATGGVNLMDFSGDADADNMKDGGWYNVEIAFSGARGDPWEAVKALYAFVSDSDDETFARDAQAYLDFANCADYYLFVNFLGATDNMNKNIVLAAYDASASGRLYFVPWDVDACLGRRYNAAPADPEYMSSNGLFDRLLTLPEFEALLKSRYAALRQTVFDADAVLGRFEAYAALFEASGAYAREKERFPVYQDAGSDAEYALNLPEELLFIRDYLTRRTRFLDARFHYAE